MSKVASPIPEGYHTITPYLIIENASDALEFYKKAFNAEENLRFTKPDGKISHAEIKIGDSHIMLADEFPEMNAHSPRFHNGSPISLYLYVANVDQLVEQAVKVGAKLLRKPEDMFYGDRVGAVEDPFGYRWYISTHIEDVTVEEVKRRAAHFYSKKD